MGDEQPVQDRLHLLYQLSAQMASFGPVLATKMSVLSTVSLPWGLGAAGAETVKQGVDSGNPEGASSLHSCHLWLARVCTLYAKAVRQDASLGCRRWQPRRYLSSALLPLVARTCVHSIRSSHLTRCKPWASTLATQKVPHLCIPATCCSHLCALCTEETSDKMQTLHATSMLQ